MVLPLGAGRLPLGCGFAAGLTALWEVRCGAWEPVPDDSARPPFPPVFGPCALRQMAPLLRCGVPLLFKVQVMTSGLFTPQGGRAR